MCQLLGMNCNVPTDICFSFHGFCNRGGKTDHHSDGWGIAFFEGKGCRLFVDDQPSATSPLAELIRHYPIRSLNTIAHIRKATIGKVALENSHPFARELWGEHWIFAHNGDLPGYRHDQPDTYHPVGSTDSEMAFCHMMDRLRQTWPDGKPPLAALYAFFKELTQEIAAFGTFNFLLSNGDFLLAHCSTHLHYLVRKAPWPVAHLIDQDVSIDFSLVTTPYDRVAIIATQPLTDNETWTRMAAGELLMFKDGLPLAFG